MVVVLAVVLIALFGSGLWFLSSQHKKNQSKTNMQPGQKTGQQTPLPPKPEERWRYIKELENRQITIKNPKAPSAGTPPPASELTPEQRHLLEQIQADMKTQAPRRLEEAPAQKTPPAKSAPVPAPSVSSRSPFAVDRQTARPAPKVAPDTPTRTPPENTVSSPRTTQPTTAKSANEAQQWLIQCGSFKTSAPAEALRAKLAFEGFESRVTASADWHRVIIGRYRSRSQADAALRRLQAAGHTGCFPVATATNR